jgi:hypothetical protein
VTKATDKSIWLGDIPNALSDSQSALGNDIDGLSKSMKIMVFLQRMVTCRLKSINFFAPERFG